MTPPVSASRAALAPVKVKRLAQAIADQIEALIVEGSFRPGDALPAERALAEQLGVSRSSLREGIQKLVERGRLVSRHGGGTFVSDQLQASLTAPWQQVVAQHPTLRAEVLEFRRMLEGHTARFAAERATEADIERLRLCFVDLQTAHTAHDQAALADADAAFHRAIADAAHNAMYSHVLGGVFSIMHAHVHDNLDELFGQPEVADALLLQHRQIFRAIKAGEPKRAQAAAEAHIDFVAQTLTAGQAQLEREARAARRQATVAKRS